MADMTSSAGSAGGVSWRGWGRPAFEEAAATGRPVLLNLTAYWCRHCRLMEETTYADPGIVSLLATSLVPVRVDADRYPHVQDRYIAGGWPTTAFLTPTGEVLWAGTYMDATELRTVADSVLGAWRERRQELEREIERRRFAVEASRSRSEGGLVRRERADDVLTAAKDAFDPRNGGFGDAPKFPLPELVELLYVHGAEDADCAAMADRTLDGMLAGELWDEANGGFFRYALAEDWTEPRQEKLLDVNAGLLEAYALGSVLRGRADWRARAEGIVAWADGMLALDGLWSASERAADDGVPAVDPTLITSANARWIHALALAGSRLERPDWVARADAGLRALLELMTTPDGTCHFREEGGAPSFDVLLIDPLECARAALMLAQATGAAHWTDTARELARRIEARFWNAEGGFSDRVHSADDIGMLRYHDRPFEANAIAARLLLDLSHVTGERHWRALAERTLAAIGAVAGRHGTSAAVFALATEAFFEPPPTVFITGPAADEDGRTALRHSAFALPVAGLRVWTVPSGHAVGPQTFRADGAAAAWISTRRGCAGPFTAAGLAVHGAPAAS
jgi:uncharacterized protein